MSDAKNTFETFIGDKSNQFALVASKAVTINPSKYYNPLWIYGPSGVGKSHLLQAIHHKLSEDQETSVLYLSARDLAENLVDLLSNKPTRWGYIEQVNVLIIDNLECLRGCKATQFELAKLFCEKRVKGQQVVLASACPPKKLLPLYESFRKKCENVLIADIQRPEPTLRANYVLEYFKKSPVAITDEAIEYLSTRLNSIPKIKGCLKKATIYYASKNQPIDKSTIKRFILFGGID